MSDHMTAVIVVEVHSLAMPDFDDLKARIEEAAAAHKATVTVDGRRHPGVQPAPAERCGEIPGVGPACDWDPNCTEHFPKPQAGDGRG